MIRLTTDNGVIAVDSAVYTNIAGYAATNCFGVKGMAVRSMFVSVSSIWLTRFSDSRRRI